MGGESSPASWLALGFVAQVAACAVVGTRLLVLAARTRKLPELAFGFAFVVLGVIGFPISVAARNGLTQDPELAGWLLEGGLSAQNLGLFALSIGTWRIFRPGQRSATVAVAVLGGLLVSSILGHHQTAGFAGGNDDGFWYYVGLWTRTAVCVWAALESLRYGRMMHRRMRLGIADPVVADRFRLWGIACVSLTVGFLAFGVSRMFGVDAASSTGVLAISCGVGLACGGSLWLAFFPPGWYLRRIAMRGVALRTAST